MKSVQHANNASSNTKYEWRKKEKSIYLPKNKPEFKRIPAYKFITLAGEGNPNSPAFADYIGALYSVAYAIKMTLKKQTETPPHYTDWTVYPLEGIWDITEEAKKNFSGKINKDQLVFNLMLRQPDFIDDAFFEEMRAFTQKKKPQPLLEKLKFETITDGHCIQMMHIGSYDNEDETFTVMEDFASEKGLSRKSKIHREIYLSDFRKVPAEKLKTVLRFQVDESR